MSKAKNLILIDDTAIRESHFSAANKIIRKIERLESAIATFHSSDQKLFGDWFDLTFRKEREEANEKTIAYRKLAEFHNSIVAASQMLDISMPDAFRLIREEEDRYQKGDQATREKIEQTRREREQFARDEMAREYREENEDFDSAFGSHLDDENETDNDDDCDSSQAQEADISPEDLAEINRIESMTEKKLRQSLRDFNQGLEILLRTFRFAIVKGNPRPFLRAWDLAPHKVRLEVEQISREGGFSIKAQIEDMREWLNWAIKPMLMKMICTAKATVLSDLEPETNGVARRRHAMS
ncbi:MAG: hypothetical protein HC902_01660 [Calothrix sp. SM1_5_4]|nr:hypothetical protein [Calothrix sp. SM1_5_4]